MRETGMQHVDLAMQLIMVISEMDEIKQSIEDVSNRNPNGKV